MSNNYTILLKQRPKGEPSLACFERRSEPIPVIADGKFLYRTLFLSIDPYLRGRMNEGKSYIEPFALGAPILSAGVVEVTESRVAGFSAGDRVLGMVPWANFGTSDGTGMSLLPKSSVSPSVFLGVLGMPGLTAFVGLFDIARAKSGETVVVSAASGAVGAVAVQLAKRHECRVIGIAGGAEKCAYVKNELGADACIDYRRGGLREALAETCPDGIDVYFENVGGETFEAVLANLRDHARIALCGMISEYNAVSAPPGPNLRPLLVHKAMLRGFVVMEHWDRFSEFQAEVLPLVQKGQMKFREDILEGLERAPEALLRLLQGKNFGKQLVKL